MISAERLADKWGYKFTEPKVIRAYFRKEKPMIMDIEVVQWDYKVYFNRESNTPRLVYCFETEKEAETCVFAIKEKYGLHAWYTPVRELKCYKEGE